MPDLMYVVARDRVDLYEHLRASFRDVPEVAVVLDRRRQQRRRTDVSYAPERRRRTRRRHDVTRSLLTLGWTLVRVTRPVMGTLQRPFEARR
jgi:hypothetical protein